MASKKPLSALGDKSATDLAKLAGQVGSQGLAKRIADINAPFLSATDLVKAISQFGIASDFDKHLPALPPKIDLRIPDLLEPVQATLPRPFPESTQDLAKHIAGFTVPKDALTNLGEGLLPSDYGLKLNATDLAKALLQFEGADTLLGGASEPVPKINLQLPDMSQGVRISLPHPIEESSQQQNRETGSDKTIVSRANRGEEVDELEIVSPSDLGLLVRRARETRHLSQQSFADLAGVGRRFLSELENGKPTLELGKVLKVVRAAGISLLARQR
ncbi:MULTISPECIES: helix-turn-helix transcriptional regulator [unclassified Aminobacter]|uniref:helix-turn-helix transcriptional regulator n=1 Tax=unclassified Aminobacter TaxID=2644704 RepID=UPI00226A1586|nr:helix-turn-helix transcriptional regulator [Aminobacter sp. MET-1]MCX8571839.1 helix-turn-helix transcriptional regulator [Aminobacter sp. MET-1]